MSNIFFLALLLILSNAQHQTTEHFNLLSYFIPLKHIAVETVLLHYSSLMLLPLWFFINISEHSATFPTLIPDSASSVVFQLLVIMNCLPVTAFADIFIAS